MTYDGEQWLVGPTVDVCEGPVQLLARVFVQPREQQCTEVVVAQGVAGCVPGEQLHRSEFAQSFIDGVGPVAQQ